MGPLLDESELPDVNGSDGDALLADGVPTRGPAVNESNGGDLREVAGCRSVCRVIASGAKGVQVLVQN